jgi:hypothetical protein
LKPTVPDFIVTLLFWSRGLHCHNERGLRN